MGVPNLLGGSSGGWLTSRLSARPRCQRVQSMNLKVECPGSYLERYSHHHVYLVLCGGIFDKSFEVSRNMLRGIDHDFICLQQFNATRNAQLLSPHT